MSENWFYGFFLAKNATFWFKWLRTSYSFKLLKMSQILIRISTGKWHIFLFGFGRSWKIMFPVDLCSVAMLTYTRDMKLEANLFWSCLRVICFCCKPALAFVACLYKLLAMKMDQSYRQTTAMYQIRAFQLPILRWNLAPTMWLTKSQVSNFHTDD